MNDTASAAQASLTAALRQVVNQLLRLLEERDPSSLLENGGNFGSALESWRRSVEAHTSTLSVQKSRELEEGRLQAMARAARLEKESTDFRERNVELRAEIVRLNKREEGLRQQLLEIQFARDGQKAEAKRLDLEVRDLQRRIRELEGGPPLTPAEAAPRSTPDAPIEPKTEPVEEGEIASRLGMSSARSAVEQAFKSMWRPAADEAAESSPTAKPVAKRPTATSPAAKQKPTAKQPAAKQPAAKQTSPKQTSKKPGAKKPAAKQTSPKKPGAKKPAAKKPAAKKPAAKKPAAKKPANKPTAKKPTRKQTTRKRT